MVGVTEKDGVAFSKVMGGMRLDELRHLGDFGVWFQYYFPLIIPLVAALTLFNVTGRILSMFRIPQFEFSTLATEAIEEGREILRRGNFLIWKY